MAGTTHKPWLAGLDCASDKSFSTPYNKRKENPSTHFSMVSKCKNQCCLKKKKKKNQSVPEL